jgi:hypothetical protein
LAQRLEPDRTVINGVHAACGQPRDLYFGRFIYIAARFFISAAGPLRHLPRIPGFAASRSAAAGKKRGVSGLVVAQSRPTLGLIYKNRRRGARGKRA